MQQTCQTFGHLDPWWAPIQIPNCMENLKLDNSTGTTNINDFLVSKVRLPNINIRRFSFKVNYFMSDSEIHLIIALDVDKTFFLQNLK